MQIICTKSQIKPFYYLKLYRSFFKSKGDSSFPFIHFPFFFFFLPPPPSPSSPLSAASSASRRFLSPVMKSVNSQISSYCSLVVSLQIESGPMNSGNERGRWSWCFTRYSVSTFSQVYLILPAEKPSEICAKVLNGKSGRIFAPCFSMNCLHIRRRVE